MATRVEPVAAINFGTVAGASVTASKFRVRKGAITIVAAKDLAAARTWVTGDPMRIAAGELDLLYPSGDMEDAHMNAMLTAYYTGIQIDLLDASDAVLSDTGYSAQTLNTAAWSKTNESD